MAFYRLLFFAEFAANALALRRRRIHRLLRRDRDGAGAPGSDADAAVGGRAGRGPIDSIIRAMPGFRRLRRERPRRTSSATFRRATLRRAKISRSSRCRAFARPAPVERQTWRIRLSASGVQALCDFPRQALEFPRGAFAADPRIAALNWDRAGA